MIALLTAVVILSGLGHRPSSVAPDGIDYKAQLEKELTNSPALAEAIRANIPNCPDLTYVSTGYREISRLDGISDNFYKTEFQKPGILEAIHVSGCGEAFTANVAAVAKQGGALTVAVRFFGETRAGLLLQNDATRMVFAFVGAAYKAAHPSDECQTPNALVVDRRVENVLTTNAWTERWTTSYCGELYPATIAFTPDAAGTGVQFNVQLVPHPAAPAAPPAPHRIPLALNADRPAELVGDAGLEAYRVKLENRINENTLRQNYIGRAIPDCDDFKASADAREVAPRDIRGIKNFYSEQVRKPAMIERVIIAGCGKTYQINYMAERRQDNPQLNFLLMMSGDTLVGVPQTAAAYGYAARMGLSARQAAGMGAPCTSAFAYNSKVISPPVDDGPWTEDWSVDACGHRSTVEITFKPKLFSDLYDMSGVLVAPDKP